jgi:pimeloyl-ACP methyl ester carboxylesterase
MAIRLHRHPRVPIQFSGIAALVLAIGISVGPTAGASEPAAEALGPATKVRRAYAEGPYGQVHIYLAGEKGSARRPMVCFHQSPLSGRTFDALMKDLGRDRLVVAPDTPGYGLSDPPDKSLTIPEYARALGVTIDAMNLGEIDVCGVHTGARIAVEFTRQHRKQVKHVVLVGVGAYTDAERARQRAWTGAPLEKTEDGAYLMKVWHNWAQFRTPGVTYPMIERYMSDVLRDMDRKVDVFPGIFDHDMAAALADIDQPILAFAVRDDIYDATMRSQKYMKNGRVIDLSPTGLWPLELRTQEIAQAVRALCDR